MKRYEELSMKSERSAGKPECMKRKRFAGKPGGRGLRPAAAAVLMGMSVVCANAVPAAGLAAAFSLSCAQTAWAVEAGTYLVTVSPSYTDPETGKIEDPGNNEAIGQGMTQKLCGPQGLLEVDASGNMYLTVRYYLSQFVSDVSFEERSGGSYQSCPYEKMQVKDPVSGAANLDDKYGYTDYRIPIQSLSSVFRGKAYIEPMGRNVVYFFQASSPVPGSGDFVATVQTEAQPAAESWQEGGASAGESWQEGGTSAGESWQEAGAPAAEDWQEYGSQTRESWQEAGASAEEGWQGADPEFAESRGSESQTARTAKSKTSSGLDDGINGSGDADAPVTGIPQKPGRTARETAAALDDTEKGALAAGGRSDSDGADENYSLKTDYDLSQAPLDEARELAAPVLEEAVGITQIVGSLPAVQADDSGKPAARQNTNRTVMLVLLGISAVLAARLAAALLAVKRPKRTETDSQAESTAQAAAANQAETAAQMTAASSQKERQEPES